MVRLLPQQPLYPLAIAESMWNRQQVHHDWLNWKLLRALSSSATAAATATAITTNRCRVASRSCFHPRQAAANVINPDAGNCWLSAALKRNATQSDLDNAHNIQPAAAAAAAAAAADSDLDSSISPSLALDGAGCDGCDGNGGLLDWLAIDFGEAVEISRVRLTTPALPMRGCEPKRFKVQASAESIDGPWQDIRDGAFLFATHDNNDNNDNGNNPIGSPSSSSSSSSSSHVTKNLTREFGGYRFETTKQQSPMG
jgi:hypothetical protein